MTRFLVRRTDGEFPGIERDSDEAKAVVRRNTEEVQGQGKFEVFEELFADDFVDHTTQPGTTPDKAGVRKLYTYMRQAFPDFRAEIHWQLVDGDRVTTYKTYYGAHEGAFLGIANLAGLRAVARSYWAATTRENHRLDGGGGGIRTPETLSGLTVFKTAGFNRSPTPPFLIVAYSAY